MTVEHLVRRTIYVSECSTCGDRDERTDIPPRERWCKCGRWVAYQAINYIGPDLPPRERAR